MKRQCAVCGNKKQADIKFSYEMDETTDIYMCSHCVRELEEDKEIELLLHKQEEGYAMSYKKKPRVKAYDACPREKPTKKKYIVTYQGSFGEARATIEAENKTKVRQMFKGEKNPNCKIISIDLVN